MENRLVNWKDGMMLSADHLFKTEDYFFEYISELGAAVLETNGYGLMERPVDDRLVTAYESNSGELYISVLPMLYLTEGGHIIHIPHGEALDYITTGLVQAKEDERYAVLVNLHPDKRSEFGEADTDEQPPRVQWSRVKLSVSLHPFSSIKSVGNSSAVVGVIRKLSGSWTVDKNYIAPVSKVKYSRELCERLQLIHTNMDRLIALSATIIDKIYLRGREYSLADNIFRFVSLLLGLLEEGRFFFMSKKYDISPYEIRLFFSRISGGMIAFMKSLSAGQRGELLDYVNEWCLIPPGIFMRGAEQVSEADYCQTDIAVSFFKIEDYIRSLLVFMEQLVKLEFVGQRKENIVIS